jgi:hypothetical protein
MAIRRGQNNSLEARLFYVAFVLVCLANLAYYGLGALRLPRAIKMVQEGDDLAGSIVVARVAWFLTIGILVWLLVHVYQLISAISNNATFGSENPRRVRKIAYGALALGVVTLLSEGLIYLMTPVSTLKMLVYNLMGLPMWAFFFFFVLLVIARVFEEGLKMKENENLTI